MSDYPAVTLRPGETSSISLKLQNYDLPPERLALSVSGVPAGWTATLMGGGQPVGAAMPATNASVPLELRLDVPKNATVGTETLTVTAAGGSSTVTLPIAVTLAKDLPAKLTLTPQLPQLRGTSKSSFEFQLAIKNDSGKKLTVSLSAQTPQNFDASFSEQYGSQELNAVPIEAGQTKNVKLKVTPPNTAAAGSYKVVARVGAEDAVATTELTMDITGQPKLDISGRDGLLSTSATAGKEKSIPIIITNTGTAPADQVELSGSAPSGWKITFDPKTIDRIAPNANKEVQALITPTEKAIAGDYVTTIRASTRGESASARPSASRWRPRRCGASPASASSVWRFWSWSVPSRGSAGDERGQCHRGQGSDQDLRPRDRCRSHLLHRRSRRDLRAARAERCGQDDDDLDAARSYRDFQRRRERARLQPGARAAFGQAPCRLLPDTVGFYDQMTAVDNLSYTARLIGFRKAEREKRIADALARVGLTEAAENRVGTFSRGMRQRLGLAEILMKGAQVAILDEPTSGLDPHATAELLAIIRGFKGEGVTVLLSSHLLERVQSVCDRVALFSGGHIALMGTVAELGREVLGGGYVVDIEADGAGLAERLTLIPGVSGVERTGIGKLRLHADRDVRPEAAAEVVAMQGRLKYLGVQEPSLDAIYTRYFEVKAQEAASAKAGARHAA